MPDIGYGARLRNEYNAFIPADEKIRPLRDQIVVEPLESNFSTIIDAQWDGEVIRGKVLAVGPGVYPKRYNGPKGKRTKSWDSKAFRPCDVKVGDIVQLGGLEIGGYLHINCLWGHKRVVICREEDVTGIER